MGHTFGHACGVRVQGVQKVQRVQRVQRVVVAASPQIIAAGAAGWVEGLLASPCGR